MDNQTSEEWEVRINFKCSTCGSLQHKGSELMAHSIKSHCKNRFYWCHECKSYSTNEARKLFYHVECIHGESSCMVCPLCFDFYGCDEKDIKDHIYRSHWTVQKVYCCKLCRYKCESSIDQHIQKTHKSYSVGFHGTDSPLVYIDSDIDQHIQKTDTSCSVGFRRTDSPLVYIDSDDSSEPANADNHSFNEICSGSSESYPCYIVDCSFEGENDCEMFQHIVSTHFPHLSPAFKCTYCLFLFSSLPGVVNHIVNNGCDVARNGVINYSASVTIFCRLCPDYSCQRKNTYMKHIKKYHELIYVCPFDDCGYETEKFWEFWDHAFDEHLNNEFHECPLCYEQCSNESGLEEHFDYIHHRNLYPICFCRYTGSAIQHLKEFHDFEFPKTPCRLCGMIFEEDLLGHLENFHGISPLEGMDYLSD